MSDFSFLINLMSDLSFGNCVELMRFKIFPRRIWGMMAKPDSRKGKDRNAENFDNPSGKFIQRNWI
jgi:hypothetical protein